MSFGHAKGVFTGADARAGRFEMSSNGTFFGWNRWYTFITSSSFESTRKQKDTKVGGGKEIPLNLRMVCATSKSRKKLMKDHLEDLFYRINVFPIMSYFSRKRRYSSTTRALIKLIK